MAHKVVDTTYYEALNVPVNASDLEIKKAYRRLAIIHHPGRSFLHDLYARWRRTNLVLIHGAPLDKNPGDATAHEKFQAVGHALSYWRPFLKLHRLAKHIKSSATQTSGDNTTDMERIRLSRIRALVSVRIE